MTLERLKELNPFFKDFITVKDSALPDTLRPYVPELCECGSEVILTTPESPYGGFTQVQCCNPECWVKMAHRLEYFLKHMGYKGIGVKTLYPLYKEYSESFETKTFLALLEFSVEELSLFGNRASADKLKLVQSELATKSFDFKDVVVALGIPEVGKSSPLFSVVHSKDELLTAIQPNQLSTLYKVAGITAPNSKYQFAMSLLDIAYAFLVTVPNIRSTPTKEIFVAITGTVEVDGTSYTRQEFINLCADKGYRLSETKAASKLQYVVADAPSSSSKYELGKKLGILITATEFYRKLCE